MRVCALVVTYNRLDKLRNCLAALAGQTAPPASVIVVDNASTDGTEALFSGSMPPFPLVLRYERLPRNSGGAGGFAHGLRSFLATDAEAVWLMDDDSLPQPACLAELLDGQARALALGLDPDILASRVLQNDGSLHPWNIPLIRYAKTRHCFDLIDAGLFPIRSASFVSTVIRRKSVLRAGLPHATYFIYNDDIEYTGRILRAGTGIVVPRSICVHDTGNVAEFRLPPERLRFEVRNKLWMITHSQAWTAKERLYFLLLLGKNILNHLRPLRQAFANCPAILRGCLEGLLTGPGEAR